MEANIPLQRLAVRPYAMIDLDSFVSSSEEMTVGVSVTLVAGIPTGEGQE